MLFRLAEGVPAEFARSALSIGNFDGVHSGHRALMQRVVAVARENALIPAVLTFDPHPLRVLAPDRAPKLLTTLERRAELLQDLGIEAVVALEFTPELSRLSPREFVRQILVEKLHARAVLVGDNFRFGHRAAAGTPELREFGSQYGFTVEIVPAVTWRGRPVSSSEIRRLIQNGDVALAGRMLLRPYALQGTVVPGQGIGSKQTVPTLNLQTNAEVLPATGVYVTCTTEASTGRTWPSVTNIGYRPTFGGDKLTIETFLLKPLEGATPKEIRVEFLRRLRGERKFETPEALKTQILRDVQRAEKYFRLAGSLYLKKSSQR